MLAAWTTHFHPQWGSLAAATAQYFGHARVTPAVLIANWRGFAAALAAALGLAAIALAAGRRLAAVAGRRRPSRTLDAALGAGVAGLGLLGLGLDGLLFPLPHRLALAALAGIAAWEGRRLIERGAFGRAARAAWPDGVSWPTGGFLLAAVGFTAVGVFNIEMGWDALVYHLRLPAIALAQHRIGDVWHHYCSPFPSLIEMLYAAGLGVRDDQTARLLNALLGVGVLAALRHLARAARAPAGLALALCLGSPVFLLLLTRAYVDLGVTLFLTLALAELVRWSTSGSRVSLVLSGLFAGCAMGSKYTAVLVLPAAGAAAWPGGGRRPRLPGAGIWLAAAAAPLLPWLVKNWLLKGNPVSPLLGGVFGTHEIIPGDIAPLGGAAVPWRALVRALPGHVTALLYDHGRIDGPVACAVAGLAPLVALRPGGPLSALRRAVLAYAAGWFLLSPDARFFLPILPAVCVVEGAAFAALAPALTGGLRALRATVEAGLVLGAAYALFIQWVFFSPLSLALGLETPAAKLALGLQPAPSNGYATAWLNQHVPAGERIWFVADFSTYYVHRECLADFPFGRSKLADLLAEARSPEALAKRLRQRGFRWICSTGSSVAQYFARPDYFAASPAAWASFKTLLATRADVAFQTEQYTVFRLGPPHPARPLPDLPVVATVAFHAADLALEAGRAEEAMRVYLAPPPLLRDVGSTFVRRGDAAMVLGDMPRALAAFAQALALGADNPRVRSGLGNALLRLGRVRDALPHNEEAWRQNPRSANAAGTLALNLSQVGRADDARRLILEAVRLRPDDPEYRALALQLGASLVRPGP